MGPQKAVLGFESFPLLRSGTKPEYIQSLYSTNFRLRWTNLVLFLKGYAQLLESVQRWTTRISYARIRPSFKERLGMLNMQTFVDRKERKDLIFAYRTLHGFLGLDLAHLFTINDKNLRGHDYKLGKECSWTTSRQKPSIHPLPSKVVNAVSVIEFKNKLESYMLH